MRKWFIGLLVFAAALAPLAPMPAQAAAKNGPVRNMSVPVATDWSTRIVWEVGATNGLVKPKEFLLAQNGSVFVKFASSFRLTFLEKDGTVVKRVVTNSAGPLGTCLCLQYSWTASTTPSARIADGPRVKIEAFPIINARGGAFSTLTYTY